MANNHGQYTIVYKRFGGFFDHTFRPSTMNEAIMTARELCHDYKLTHVGIHYAGPVWYMDRTWIYDYTRNEFESKDVPFGAFAELPEAN